MAKAPQAGRAKTRLVPPLTPAEAAALGAAFLRDITENIAAAARDLPIAGCVAYAPAGAEALFAGNVAAGTRLILADGAGVNAAGVQGFGRALLHATQAALARDFSAVCLVNADSPTLPTEYLRSAAALLLAGGDDRVVLGPAEDGGYYLIGVRAAHAALFTDIAWSTPEVAAQTRARAWASGLEVVELPAWYDVDDPDNLRRLLVELSAPSPPPEGTRGAAEGGVTQVLPYPAPATAACLRRLGLAALLDEIA